MLMIYQCMHSELNESVCAQICEMRVKTFDKIVDYCPKEVNIFEVMSTCKTCPLQHVHVRFTL